jgi:2-polyprenyl-3-methyl-5-hydroxy-6-metoxy-1,4-benzoquinol methylase
MPLLSSIARKRKLEYFRPHIPQDAQILEIGCADGWVARSLKASGYTKYVGIDLVPTSGAGIAGDIRDWRKLGLPAASFDVIIAFEVIEHVPCVQDCYDLLRPGGLLMLTSPVPSMDWLCRTLELVGLNQRRTSPHSNLTDFSTIPLFKSVARKNPLGIAQWGVFRKPIV